MTEGSPASWREKVFKVLVIGDPSVGKSSIILRYVDKRFVEKYKASIGVDFTLKTIQWDPQTVVRLQFWDIAGQERFKSMSRVYYKGAMGALVVFDITNRSSLEAASEWKQDLDKKSSLDSGRLVPAVLLANKCDLNRRNGDMSWLNSFCEENSFSGWFETSAKDNVNIGEAIHFLLKRMMLGEGGSSDDNGDQWGRAVVSLASEDGRSRRACC